MLTNFPPCAGVMQQLSKAFLPQHGGQGCPVAPGSLPQLNVAWCSDTWVLFSSSYMGFLVFVCKIFPPLTLHGE